MTPSPRREGDTRRAAAGWNTWSMSTKRAGWVWASKRRTRVT